MTTATRRELVQDLLRKHTNDFGNSDDARSLLRARYVVVVSRDDDAWVLAANTLADIAGIELNVYTNFDGYPEWVEAVYVLETGELLTYTAAVSVTLTCGDETVVAP